MVPSFGLFEFEADHSVYVSSEDQERVGYLAEIVMHSTEFSTSRMHEARAHRAVADDLNRIGF
ncbi:MAG: hypothetical protein CGU29_12910 [Candidatus Dactylopiibacterium carminicum]|uniref:Uncharacterized protein n=1 Tax=Candidatus Dactylopiibacterium carminicum TaxID=857335 RepID=A0A272EPV6_9RHOO|nr:hypothetical protein [Candidatus Dactylopiibacterium carminicum]KAF7598410.1 hypothetical protein BGI27_13540 [Candidatus Dactylopiibacterium carminicum]PAS92157.1 MAG: hypothetical protein CGU29_12910 [Candidatus Dactylopiibacterium carminicum]PAS97575.1 MAG: hypothetical protein BSR46_13565 [Candidatus Dactylopiibacterium carminicum]